MESKIIITADSPGGRIDIFLSEKIKEFSRSRLQQLIKEGYVKVNGKVPRQSLMIYGGELIEIEQPPLKEAGIKPEPLTLDIIYEDDDMIIINKEKGMVVHPGPGHQGGTLVNALLHYSDNLSGIGGVRRPGILHRLDKDTSGLLMVAKNDYIHQKLSLNLKKRLIKKEYIAVVWGRIPHEKIQIDAPLGRDPRNRKKIAVIEGGREAFTLLRRFSYLNECTFIGLLLQTGRTHQIRAHLSYIGHPLVGDSLYGGYNKILKEIDWEGQALHAHRLTFDHPRNGHQMSFKAPIPSRFRELVHFLRNIRKE